METATFASQSVTKLLERLAYRVNHTAHAHDDRAVHDLRVAIRRFGQALAIFKSVFSARQVKKIRRRLDSLMDLSNEIRDCDVALELLADSELAGAPAVLDQVRLRRKDALLVLLPALKRWSERKTSSKWRAALAPQNGAHVPVDVTVSDRLPKLVKRFLKGGDRARDAAELHQVRIDGKKLRYTLELLRPVYGARAAQPIEQMKTLQSTLGKVNDCRAVRRLVVDLGGDAEVEDWLKTRQRKKMRAFRREWPDTAQALRHSTDALVRPPRKPMARSTTARPAVAKRA